MKRIQTALTNRGHCYTIITITIIINHYQNLDNRHHHIIAVERISPLKRIQTAITGVMGRIDRAGVQSTTTQWLALPNGRTPTTQWLDLKTHHPLTTTQWLALSNCGRPTTQWLDYPMALSMVEHPLPTTHSTLPNGWPSGCTLAEAESEISPCLYFEISPLVRSR